MKAPKRKPYFCDAIGGKEFTFPDTGPEIGWLLDSLASSAKTFPDWQLDNDGRDKLAVQLAVLDHLPNERLVIGFICAGRSGVITVRPHPTGYALVEAEMDGGAVFSAYMDRPYEEYGLYPAGDETDQADESPGRMSKHLWWLSLSVKAWPQLRELTHHDFFNVHVPDR